MKESDSGEKDEVEDEDHHMTLKIHIKLDQKQQQKPTLLKCSVVHAFCMTSKRNKYNF